MSRRRGNGEGSIWFDRKVRLWKASLELGYTPDGKRVRWTAKAKTKTRILEKVDKARVERAATGTVSRRPAPREILTVSAWLTIWLNDIQKHRLRPGTWKNQRNILTANVTPKLGDIALTALTVDDVRGLLLAIRDDGRIATSKAAHRHLSAALAAAVAEGKIERNVAALVKLSRADAHRDDSLDITEARAILTHVRTSPDVALRDRLLTELRLFLGTRPQELLGLEPDRALDLDGVDPRIEVSWQLQPVPFRHGCGARPCGKGRPGWCPKRAFDVPEDFEYRPVDGGLCLVRPKTARSIRALPIPASTASALAQYLTTRPATDLPVLFVDDAGRAIRAPDDIAAWRAICAAAGIARPVDRYIGRHTAASLMASLGTVDAETQRDLMGHTNIAMTNQYKHRSRAQLRLAVSDLEDALTTTDDEQGETLAETA